MGAYDAGNDWCDRQIFGLTGPSHAYLLQIEHPRTGEVMRFESDLPDDLMELIDALRI